MGESNVQIDLEPEHLRAFMRALLNDLRALEVMIREDMFESGVRRIGAEQELFLVDKAWRPALACKEILEELNDPHFTTELAQFNLEFNCDPLVFSDDCLSQLEAQLQTHYDHVDQVAHNQERHALMTGILPTLQKSNLGLDSMTPVPRYYALNEAMNRLRGGSYIFRIKGADEFIIQHDSVMLESCNTSFQIHFQVSTDEFARFYNIAQAVLGPVLAAATNSPLLFGKRLWHETRIALFQQSVDTRGAMSYQRELNPRVSFGTSWVRESVLEIFREDIARFRVLMGTELDGDPFDAISQGTPPSLKALRLHNGTIYRWNRPCYGILDGKPHLRIENRVLPAGPTVIDAVANAAFYFGLMSSFLETYGDITEHMEFDDAKTNFMAAARHGLGAQFTWIGGRDVSARELIINELVPMARQGLKTAGVRQEDIDRYLGVLEARVRKNQTGSQWMLRSLASFKDKGTRSERMAAIVAAAHERQKENRPVHEWPLASLEEAGGWQRTFLRVEQYMNSDVITVNEHELVDLVANMMSWNNIRHVPVEDNDHHLVGMVNYTSLLALMADGFLKLHERLIPVRDIMLKDPVTISPHTPTVEAIELMREHDVDCLPVCQDGRLVGMVTERDFMKLAGQLLQQTLRQEED